jgi:hypothetical protein
MLLCYMIQLFRPSSGALYTICVTVRYWNTCTTDPLLLVLPCKIQKSTYKYIQVTMLYWGFCLVELGRRKWKVQVYDTLKFSSLFYNDISVFWVYLVISGHLCVLLYKLGYFRDTSVCALLLPMDECYLAWAVLILIFCARFLGFVPVLLVIAAMIFFFVLFTNFFLLGCDLTLLLFHCSVLLCCQEWNM